MTGPQVMVWFWKIMKSIGCLVWLEEVNYWGWALGRMLALDISCCFLVSVVIGNIHPLQYSPITMMFCSSSYGQNFLKLSDNVYSFLKFFLPGHIKTSHQYNIVVHAYNPCQDTVGRIVNLKLTWASKTARLYTVTMSQKTKEKKKQK